LGYLNVGVFTMSKDDAPYLQDVKELEAFLKGYKRDVHMTANVLSALAKSMDAHPQLRLGQLLVAVIKKAYPNDEGFEGRLFYIYDEDFVNAINAFDGELIV
jgi:hypothetical protein